MVFDSFDFLVAMAWMAQVLLNHPQCKCHYCNLSLLPLIVFVTSQETKFKTKMMPYNKELNGAMLHYLSSFEQANTCRQII